MKNLPPKFAIRLLRWFCREDCLEEIEGDLTEIFEKGSGRSPVIAKWKFTWQVIRYLRPAFMKSFRTKQHAKPVDMIYHNMLITFRNFRRHKNSFFINLIGLTAGLSAVMLIYLWVYDELSVDKFHEKDNRLYQVMRNTPGPANSIETHNSNSVLLCQALKDELPQVEYVVPMRPTPAAIVSAGQVSAKATGAFAGKDFFNVFSYNVVQGKPGDALQEKYSVAISEALATKLFGSTENCIGKTINWDLDHFGGDHIVSAVFSKPNHSSEEFDFLVTYELFLEKNRMDVKKIGDRIRSC